MLIRVVKRGDPVTIRRHILNGADVNGVDPQGLSPLYHASTRGNTDAMKTLIEAGADVNYEKNTVYSALFVAVTGGHVEAVGLLLDAGAEPSPVRGLNLRSYVELGKDLQKNKAILELLSRRAGSKPREQKVKS
jgi:ankyrin repeat protein